MNILFLIAFITTVVKGAISWLVHWALPAQGPGWKKFKHMRCPWTATWVAWNNCVNYQVIIQVCMTAFLFFGQNPCECIYVYIHIAYSGYILYLKVEGLVAQSCPTIWNPPGSSIHGILQARMVEWVATPFCRGASWPKLWTWVSCTVGRFFTSKPSGKPHYI